MSEHFQQLVAYIKDHQAKGFSDDHIRQTLLDHGWDAESVDKAFAKSAPVTGHHDAAVTPHSSSSEHSVQNAPSKYKVFQAIADTVRAITKNPIAYLVAAIIGYAVTVGIVTVFIVAFFGMILSTSFVSPTGIGFLVSLVVFSCLFAVVLALVSAFTSVATSLALYDGFHGKKSVVSQLLKTALKRLKRVVLASILFSLVSYGPMVGVALLAVIIGIANGGSGASILSILLVLAATVWILIAYLRYSLTTYVALFEPDVPILQTLSRSKHLLIKGGQWFLFKGILLCVLFVIILSAVSQQNLQELSDTNNVLVNIVLIAVNALASGALAMLYFNRKKVRG